MHERHAEFINWAASYDNGGIGMTSKVKHDDWQKQLMLRYKAINRNM